MAEKPKKELPLTKNFAAIDRGILGSKKLRQLTTEGELHYFKLLVTVDSYGNFPADIEDLTAKMYSMRNASSRCRKDRMVSCDDVEMWQIELQEAGLISFYTGQLNTGEEMKLFHITNYLGCGTKEYVKQPYYPSHPDYLVKEHPSVKRKNERARNNALKHDATRNELEIDLDLDLDLDFKKESDFSTDLPVAGHLKWPSSFGLEPDSEYPVYQSELDTAFRTCGYISDPDARRERIEDWLRYHKAHEGGSHYPNGPDTVGASFVWWLRNYLKQQAERAKPKPKQPEKYLSEGDFSYDLNQPDNTEEDWEALCEALEDNKRLGADCSDVLADMARRWPGRELPA